MKHIIILKGGDSLTGEITTKNFTIKTSYATLSFTIDKIAHIHFKNLPQFPNDEMVLRTTDKLKGEITNINVSITLESSGQTAVIDKNKIHTIMFLGGNRDE